MTTTREQIIQTRDGAVKTRVLIGGDGPPVVYLHGMEGLQWDAFHDGLATGHTLYALEHVGSGESTGIEDLYNFWDLVTHYEEALDELDLPTTALIGHSFGGMVAAEVAAHLRHRITHLALLAPLGLWDDQRPIPEIDATPRPHRRALLLADPTGPLPRLLDPDPTDHQALFHAELNSASINQFCWPIADKGLHRRLYRITAPTLLLWGDHDQLVPPSYAHTFATHLTAPVTTTLIPHTGHLLHLENPHATLTPIHTHLNT